MISRVSQELRGFETPGAISELCGAPSPGRICTSCWVGHGVSMLCPNWLHSCKTSWFSSRQHLDHYYPTRVDFGKACGMNHKELDPLKLKSTTSFTSLFFSILTQITKTWWIWDPYSLVFFAPRDSQCLSIASFLGAEVYRMLRHQLREAAELEVHFLTAATTRQVRHNETYRNVGKIFWGGWYLKCCGFFLNQQVVHCDWGMFVSILHDSGLWDRKTSGIYHRGKQCWSKSLANCHLKGFRYDTLWYIMICFVIS